MTDAIETFTASGCGTGTPSLHSACRTQHSPPGAASPTDQDPQGRRGISSQIEAVCVRGVSGLLLLALAGCTGVDTDTDTGSDTDTGVDTGETGDTDTAPPVPTVVVEVTNATGLEGLLGVAVASGDVEDVRTTWWAIDVRPIAVDEVFVAELFPDTVPEADWVLFVGIVHASRCYYIEPLDAGGELYVERVVVVHDVGCVSNP